jgi:predicted nucleotidyltransferase component of viral defense system
MHFGTLHAAAATLWRQLGPALCPPGYLLCGGTALALYLGHRQSQDFDFLTMVAGDPTAIVADLAALEPALEVVDRSPHSVHLLVRNVYVSYLWRPGIRLDPGETFDGIPVASLPTLAALKCSAVANRGSRKDFVDLYALLKPLWTMRRTSISRMCSVA